MKCRLILLLFSLMGSLSAVESEWSPLPEPWWQKNVEEFRSGVITKDEIQYAIIESTTSNPRGRGIVGQAFTPPFDWLQNRIKISANMSGNLSSGYVFFTFVGHCPHGRKVGGSKRIKNDSFVKYYNEFLLWKQSVKANPKSYDKEELKAKFSELKARNMEPAYITEQEVFIVIDLPFETASLDIVFGIEGAGLLRVSHLKIEKTDYEEKLTHDVFEHGYGEPKNLEFKVLQKSKSIDDNG